MKKPVETALVIGADYRQFIEELKTRVVSARISAARAVMHDAIQLYWDIGRGIVEKQQVHGWGDSVVEMVAADLQRAFPGMSGFSLFNLWRMRQLFIEYSSPEFLAQVVPEIPKKSLALSKDQILAPLVPELLGPVAWGHHVNALTRVSDQAAPMVLRSEEYHRNHRFLLVFCIGVQNY